MIRGLTCAIAVFVLSLVVTAPVSASDAEEVKAVTEAQAALDKAFKSRDIAAIRKLTSARHLAVVPYFPTPFTVDQQMEVLDELVVKSAEVGETEINIIGGDLAMITFEKSYEGSFKGKPFPAKVFATGVWIRHAGSWIQELYQETTVPKQ